MTPTSPFPGQDLLAAIAEARTREGHLLTAGELVVLDTISSLPRDALELYARLTLRVGSVFRVAGLAYDLDCAAAIDTLRRYDLVHTAIPDDRCLPAVGVSALRDACRRLGLSTTGPRASLEERLAGRRWCEESMVMPAHRGLLRRVEELAGMDRALLVLERMGQVRWAAYTPTGGSGRYADRRHLRLQERARRGEWEPGEAERIARAGAPPWGKSAWHHAVETVLATTSSADLLATIPHQQARTVLALEREGRLAEAIAICRGSSSDPVEAIAIERTGRRLARAARLPFPPRVPLREAPRRAVRLVRAPGEGPRPRWDAEARHIEEALVARIAATGRVALHAENWLWTSLFALAFRDLYWLPLPGRLPSARLAGPLDLGTPAFHAARAPAIEARLAEMSEAGVQLGEYGGELLAGLANAEVVLALAPQLPHSLVIAILRRLAVEGWAAARGLPDLVILPGPVAQLPEAIPGKLDAGVILAEVKGPTDNLRDAQRYWHHQILESGNSVELWEVTSSPLK